LLIGVEQHPVSTAAPQPAATKTKPRWFQYRLRTLLVVMTLWAIACSWYAGKVLRVRRQREAAAAIEELGGRMHWTQPSGPAWLRNLLGDACFRTADDVDLASIRAPVSDAALAQVAEGFPKIEVFDLSWARVTDVGLKHLKALSRLRILRLFGCNITDAALENLRGLSQLEDLDLCGTGVTDAGLENLKTLTKLEGLDLRMTQVTDIGVKGLQQALPNCKITR
jgi:hypothetical protein